MSITLSALQKQRRDSAANWTAENPTLLAGEIGIESDTGYWKVGDGSTAWASLAYISGLGAEIPVSRLADGAAGQIIQTDTAGTGVEWSSTANLPLGTAAAPAYRFQGDTNTGIYSPGADQVAISTNGTGRLFVDASGNVDIASSSQALTLLNLNASTTGNASIRFNDTTANIGNINYNFTDDALTFRVNASERLRITSAGLVGVGTSSPQKSLEVNGAVRLSSDANALLELGRFSAGYGGAAISCLDSSFLRFQFAGTDRMTLTSGGSLGIGTTSPSVPLTIQADSNAFGTDIIGRAADNTSIIRFKTTDNATALGSIGQYGTTMNIATVGAGPIAFYTTNTERGRWDSSGRFLVGTSTARSNFSAMGASLFQVEGANNDGARAIAITYGKADGGDPLLVLGKHRSNTVGQSTVVIEGDGIGQLIFSGSDGTNFVTGAAIRAQVDGIPGLNDMPGRLVFSTTADGASSPTERMRIGANGSFRIGQATTDTPGLSNTTVGIGMEPSNGAIFLSRGDGSSLFVNRNSDGASTGFYRSGTLVGTISVTTTATAYNTSSDYRLKENVVPLTGAVDRVNQLQVHRFNFIADPDTTVDGFIAHEAQAVVPECVTGTKDEVDNEGNPVYQGIDQSKLVPLLTAALQEALAKIETLEARLTAAGI